MAKKSKLSAEEHYQQARKQWVELAFELGLYDEEDAIRRTLAPLEQALRQDPGHLRALALLCDLLAALPAYEKAVAIALRLIELEPTVEEHRLRHILLSLPDNEEKRAKIMERLAVKWQSSLDW